MDDEDGQRVDHVSVRINHTDTIPVKMHHEEETLKAYEDFPNLSAPILSTPSAQNLEMIEYDLCDISFCEIVIHLISLSVGSVILSVPYCTKVVFGNDVGFIITLTSLFVYLFSLNTLLWSKYKIRECRGFPGISYSSFVHFALKDGPCNLKSFTAFGACITLTVFVLFLVCGCCYNVLRAAEDIQIVYNSYWAADSIDLRLVMMCLTVPLLSLCWLMKCQYLALVSITAHVLSMLCMAAALYDDLYSSKPTGSLETLTQMPFYLFCLFFVLHALGSSTCEIPGFGSLISTMNDDEKEEQLKFNRLFAGIPALLAYAIFGFRCSLRYGTRAENSWQYAEDIQTAYQCALLANAFALLFQYPLLIHVMFDLVQNRSGKGYEESRSTSFVRGDVPRLAVTLVVFISVYNLPKVDVFLVLGNVFGSIIESLLFPAFILTLIMWRLGEIEELEGQYFAKNVMIGVLALLLTGLGTVSCTLDLLQYCRYDYISEWW